MFSSRAQRWLSAFTFSSYGSSIHSSMWNRCSGASLMANTAWLVMLLAPVMRGFSSPR